MYRIKKIKYYALRTQENNSILQYITSIVLCIIKRSIFNWHDTSLKDHILYDDYTCEM